MQSARLLVVDDERPIVSAIKQYFEGLGYGVDTAADVASARARLAERFYAVVIADLRLSRGDETAGLEVVAAACAAAADTRVIVLSAHVSPEHENLARRGGAHAFISKPCPLAELARVAAVLAGGAAQARRS